MLADLTVTLRSGRLRLHTASLHGRYLCSLCHSMSWYSTDGLCGILVEDQDDINQLLLSSSVGWELMAKWPVGLRHCLLSGEDSIILQCLQAVVYWVYTTSHREVEGRDRVTKQRKHTVTAGGKPAGHSTHGSKTTAQLSYCACVSLSVVFLLE